MSNCGCDTNSESAHRFCGQCGAPLVPHQNTDGFVAVRSETIDKGSTFADTPPTNSAAKAIPESTSFDSDPMQLTPLEVESDERLEPQTVDKKGAPGLWILGVLVVAAVGWFMFGGTSEPGQTADDVAQLESSEQTTSVPDDSETSDGDSDDGPPSTTASPSRDSDAQPNNTQPNNNPSFQPLGPVLGETTGLGIVYQNFEGKRSTLLNLDTGKRTEVGPTNWLPVAAVGQKVIFSSHNRAIAEPSYQLAGFTDALGSEISFDNPAGTRQIFLGVSSDRTIMFGLEQQDDYSDNYVLLEYSENGELQRETQSPTDSWGIGATGELTATFDGGIYRRTNDSFEQVFQGELLTEGQNIALVRRCDNAMVCTSAWYSTDSWAKLGYPVVNDSPNRWVVLEVLLGDDQWLATLSSRQPNDGTIELLNVKTGELVRTWDSKYAESWEYRDAQESIALVSADGRWLLDDSKPDAKIMVDLENDSKEFPIALSGSGQAIFVELP